MRPIIFSVFLGFAGFDPMGAAIAMSALAQGVSRSKVCQFSLMALLSTVAFGVLFSSGIGTGADYVSDALNRVPDAVYVALDFAIAIAAGRWFVKRVSAQAGPSGGGRKEESRLMAFAKRSMPLAGVLFAFWAMTDPTFWAVVALTAKDGSLPIRILCCAIWMVLGQLPLYVLTVATALGKHEKLVEGVRRILDKNDRGEKLRRILRWAINLFALVVAVYFLAEPIIYLVYGTWI